MPKKKIETTEIFDKEDIEKEDQKNIDSFVKFKSQVEKADPDHIIRLRRFNDTEKTWEWVDNIADDMIDPIVIKEKYGGGLYRMHLVDNAGRYIGSSSAFRIAGDNEYYEPSPQPHIETIIEQMQNQTKDHLERSQKLQENLIEVVKSTAKEKEQAVASTISALPNIITAITPKTDFSAIAVAIQSALELVGKSIESSNQRLVEIISKNQSSQNNELLIELMRQNQALINSLVERKRIDWKSVAEIGLNAVDYISKKFKAPAENPAVAVIQSIAELAQPLLEAYVANKIAKPELQPQPKATAVIPQANIPTEAEAPVVNDQTIDELFGVLDKAKAFDQDPKDVAIGVRNSGLIPEDVITQLKNDNFKDRLIKKFPPTYSDWLETFLNNL